MSAWNAADSVDSRGPLDVTRAATAVLDAQGVVLGWSPTAEALLGYAPGEVVGRRVQTLLARPPTPEEERAERESGRRRRRGEAFDARHRDGRVLRLAVTTCPLTSGGDGGPDRVLLAAGLEELRQWEARQAMLHGLATQSPIGLAIYDTALRLTWANSASGKEMAAPLARYVGKLADEMYPDGEILGDEYPPTLEQVMQQVLTTGEPIIDLHFRGRPPVDPAHDHIWSCSYYRLQDSYGRSLGVCEDAFDITERYRAQQRLALLVRAGGRIGASLDIGRTAWEIADVTVPQFADTVTVDLLEAVLDGEEPPAGVGLPDQPLVRLVRRTRPYEPGPEKPSGSSPAPRRGEAGPETGNPGASGPDSVRPEGVGPGPGAAGAPGRERAGYTGPEAGQREPVLHLPHSPQARGLASGRPVLQDGPGTAEGAGEPGVHSCLAVPLTARGATMGLVTFLRGRNPDRFDSDERALADELAARTAVCVDNARHFTRERTAALTLQRSLLPQHLPPQTAVEAAYRYLPADTLAGVGGDWFDVIPLSGARVGLVVGDVVGHGVRAAATMGRLRTTVRALARLDFAPEELLARLDDLVAQSAEEGAARSTAAEEGRPGIPEEDEALGVTCLYAVYDPVPGRCGIARAGHLPPAVVDPGGGVTFPDIPPGPPLGFGGLPYESAEFDLPPGSLLALFTDGLVEVRDRDIDEGLDRLGAVLGEHGRPLEELCDRVLETLLPGGPTADDAALLLVRTAVLGAGQVAVWELPDEPVSVARARSLASAQLAEWGLEELSFTTELVVSELVTNAIQHVAGPVQLRLIRDRSLLCEVSDSGHTAPHLLHAASDDESGRGLFIVAQLVQRWGTRYSTAGKTIWTEQPLAPVAPCRRTGRTTAG